MTKHPTFDASIPVLTEVIGDKAQAAAGPQLARAAEPAPAGVALSDKAMEGWDAQDWEALERRLSDRILRQLQGRVDFVLEQRIKDSIAEVLQHALADLTDQIRAGLQQTMEKVVARAITQELTHLQAKK